VPPTLAYEPVASGEGNAEETLSKSYQLLLNALLNLEIIPSHTTQTS
jgi:hypothetical protein